MSLLLTGTYTANCAVLALPDADVQKMLTLNCALAPQDVAPPGNHPVILMLGDQTNVVVPWLPFLPALNYQEVTLAVPWVVHASAPGAVMANPSRLWLNSVSPWLGGRIFGFPKRMSRIVENASTFSVQSYFAGQPILSAQYIVRGEPGTPSSFPNYAPLVPIFTELLLVRLFCIFPLVTYDFHWDMADATMQSLDMSLEVYPGADPGIPPGTYRIEGIDQQVFGGFRLAVNWQLSWPKLLH